MKSPRRFFTHSPYRQRRLFLLLAMIALPVAAEESELGWTTRAVAESRSLRTDSPFTNGLDLTTFGRDRGRIEQELRGRVGPVNLLLTATASGREGAKPDTRFVAHEAYADFSLAGERFTVGKKVLSGDVGHAFRPIDVVQRESRLQLQPPPLEGIPSISWDNFSADSAWSLIIANPGHGRRGEAKDDGSVALKLYRRLASADFHGIVRHTGCNGVEIGAAVAAVPDDSLEIHASVLAQQRAELRQPLADNASIADLLNPERALATQRIESPRKALIGATWTHENGVSLLGELWWDGTANSAEDWKRLARQAARRNALIGTPGIPLAAVAGANAASTRLFDQANLARRGLLTRLAWSDAASGWSAAADLIHSLEDGGRNLTLSAGYAADKWRVDAGLRRYGGRADSVFRLLPERSAGFVAVGVSW